MPKHPIVKAIPSQPISREVKTYRWPGSRGIVRQIGHNVFLPMLSVQVDGQEVFLLEPEAPSCLTLQEAVSWMEARVVEANKPAPVELYVPPGRGKMQA